MSMNTGIYPPLPGSGRTRRLSNSSAASDVSFRLPQYETPGSMYHLQVYFNNFKENQKTTNLTIFCDLVFIRVSDYKYVYFNTKSIALLIFLIHFKSDLDVSASEMEDNISSSVPAQLEKISKEHLYAAYKRTNEKYNKYRGRYTDLARHYRNLERENAKARVSVFIIIYVKFYFNHISHFFRLYLLKPKIKR